MGTQYPDLVFEERDGLRLKSFAVGSSNLHKAQNIVNHLFWDIRCGKHDGCAILQPTDNAVWSYALNKGMSTAKHLFTLVLDLEVECRLYEVHLYPLHISGDCMITTGIDRLTKGNLDAGVSLGFDI